MSARLWSLALWMALVAACSSGRERRMIGPDGDAGVLPDTGSVDARAPLDAAWTDAASGDAGALDGGATGDSGTSPTDAGTTTPVTELWMTAWGSGVEVYDLVGRVFTGAILTAPGGSVTGVETDPLGGVFVGGGEGLYYAPSPTASPSPIVSRTELAPYKYSHMAVGPDGRVQLIVSGQLVAIDRTGAITLLRTVPFSDVRGMAFDGADLWVMQGYTIYRIPESGDPIELVREPSVSGSVAEGLAVGADGRLYYGYPEEVRVVDPDVVPGTSARFAALPGYYAQTIAGGPDGRIYVGGARFSAGASSIHVFATDGTPLDTISTGSGTGTARDIAFPP